MKERKAIQNRFEGKVAIVTGGSSGIGKTSVEELCKEGASVLFTGLEDDGHDMVRQMVGQGFKVAYCQGDMAEEKFCRAVVAATVKQCGEINFPAQQRVFVYLQRSRRHARGLAAFTSGWPDCFRANGKPGRSAHEEAGRRFDRKRVEHLRFHRAAESLDIQRGKGRCKYANQVHGTRSGA